MIVCQLSLGVQASAEELEDGDHIWVPPCRYYVIKSPEQVVPLYIVKFASWSIMDKELEEVLAKPTWTTIEQAEARTIPPNRPAQMSADSTDSLWIGYLDPSLSDETLEHELSTFLTEHLPTELHTELQLQVVRGRYTQAKVRLGGQLPREAVLSLCERPFMEGGTERTVTVDDAHGSPGQKCPRNVAMYCRGRNLRFVDPCWCDHANVPTQLAGYTLEPLDLEGAKADEIINNFCKTMTGARVTAINIVNNETLSKLHDKYKNYLQTKNSEEPKVIELYHGTNNNILDVVYTDGLQPPSDTAPAEECEVSGGKGLSTTLCNNNCTKCVQRHTWKHCHMFGLGIYLADQALKSHRYVSEPVKTSCGNSCFRMVLCSVAMGHVLQLDGELKKPDSMHDVFSLRGLWKGDLEKMFVQKKEHAFCPDAPPAEQHDLMYVAGQSSGKSGLTVINSEYISFHPYQCLPRYEIVYEVSG